MTKSDLYDRLRKHEATTRQARPGTDMQRIEQAAAEQAIIDYLLQGNPTLRKVYWRIRDRDAPKWGIPAETPKEAVRPESPDEMFSW